MILDKINQLLRYALPYTDKIVAFINTHDLKTLSDTEHEIDGRNLFVRVSHHEPKPAQENKFETHRVYADLQLVVDGIELMQVTGSDQIKPLSAYDEGRDIQFFTANGFITDVVVRAGEFTIFYPGEAHRPSCQYQNNKGKIKKLVFKIKVG